jgi:predicted nucleic acid-binding protein
VVDAYAWIEYLDGTARGAKVRDLLEDHRNTATTSTVTLAEVLSKFIRKGKDHELALRAIEDNTALEPVDTGLAKLAGELHAEQKRKIQDFGLADAFVLATARKKSAKILTGDPHFETIPETVQV